MALIRGFLISLFVLILPIALRAQKNILELSPSLNARTSVWMNDSSTKRIFIIDTRADLPAAINKRTFTIIDKGGGIYIVHATPFDFTRWIKKVNGYIFADEQIEPRPDAGVINYDMTINRITSAWTHFPGIDGRGEIISIKENRPDTNDLDLLGKYRTSTEVSPAQENHATIMSTLAVGSGNSSFRGKGVAYNSAYSSSDFIDVLPDTPTYYRNNGINVQNHSYGTSIQNYYGVNARAFDLSVNIDSSLVHVFSAGNSGSSTSGQGVYASVPGMANITGNMKMAKNILLAGAILENGSVPSYSSRGPLYDGRIAPHLVAFGDDGTSGAAALVSGTAVLLQQQYKTIFNKQAGNSLIRALLINSARDIGNEGPDYISGFGSLDADAALKDLTAGHFINSSINANSTTFFDITVPPASRQMKVTLVWNDSASITGATRALINDLDLVVVNKQTGEQTLPWSLSGYPQLDSLRKSATRMKDTLNTIEQVSVQFPDAGTYQIRVSAKDLNISQVNFSIAYTSYNNNEFTWDYPLKNDQLDAGEIIRLRWTSSLADIKAKLEMSRDKGQSWQFISDTIDLNSGFYPMKMPDSALEIKFRMSTDSDQFVTDDVISSPERVIRYGYICDTTVLMYWDKIKGASGYQVYRLQNNMMQKLAIITDTSLIAPKGNPFHAVAALVNNREAVRGPGVNALTQNVGCYINNFFAGPLGSNSAGIALQLGTIYQVKKIEIVKLSDNSRIILAINNPQQNNISTSDQTLHQGINIYQAILTLENGAVIKSDQEMVYYLNNKSHIIFPNPSVGGSAIYILTENVDDELAEIFDMQGKKISEFILQEKQQQIPHVPVSKGIYRIRISNKGKTVERLSFIVQ